MARLNNKEASQKLKPEFIVIFVTCRSNKEARAVADALFRKRLIACANIVSGIESKFWWKGKIDTAKEILIILKAKRKDFEKIEKEIKHIHSYEVPEIIAIPIVAGNKAYLDWIDGSIRNSRA